MLNDLRNDAMLDRLQRAKQKAASRKPKWPDKHLIGINDKAVPFHRAQEMVWDSDRRIVAYLSGTQSGKCGRFFVLLSTGKRVFVSDVKVGDIVLSLGRDLKIERNTVTASFSSGIQETYRVTTASGRSIVTTKEHPVYTEWGWVPVGELSPGDWVGVPRRLPELGTEARPRAEMKLLGYLLGDGGLTHMSPVFTNADRAILDDMESILPEPCTLKYVSRYDYRISGPRLGGIKDSNPVTKLCREWGIYGTLAKHKRIPEFVFTLNNESIAHVLNALYSCDGTVGKNGAIEICLASEGMIDDIQHLLLRFGIVGRKKYKLSHCEGKEFDAWRLHFKNEDAVGIFYSQIGFTGEKSGRLRDYLVNLGEIRPNGKDVIPNFPRQKCVDILGHPRGNGQEHWDQDGFLLLRASRRENVARWMAQRLFKHFFVGEYEAYSDIYWDKIDSVKPLGLQEVFDITVENGHNFIADDIFAHNTSLAPWWLAREIQRRGSGDYLAVTASFDLFRAKFLREMLKVFEQILQNGRYWAGDKIIELADPETGKFWAERASDAMWGRIIPGGQRRKSIRERCGHRTTWVSASIRCRPRRP